MDLLWIGFRGEETISLWIKLNQNNGFSDKVKLYSVYKPPVYCR